MLPDYPIFKQKLEDILVQRFKNAEKKHLLVFADIPQQIIREAKSGSIIREDGTKHEIPMMKISQDLEWKLDDIEKLTLEDILKQIDEAAYEMAKQKSISTINEIDKAVGEVGNEVIIKGEEIRPYHFFNMLEKIILPFDEFENPIYPTVVAGNNAYEQFIIMFEEINNSEPLKNKYKEIIDIKRREWLDREATRTLVG